jgi:hypothetical protein
MKCALITGLLLVCTITVAQIGKVGINTTTPAAMLHVKDSTVLFQGAINVPANPGLPPLSGTGVRMMWYPDKAAWRGGRTLTSEWSRDSIGLYSMAYGYHPVARGKAAIALGETISASGDNAIALGTNTRATGQYAVGIGFSNIASGFAATTLGSANVASGNNALAAGGQTVASGERSTAMGSATIASGSRATALGRSTIASALASTATGYLTIAQGDQSFAMGTESQATGNNSLAHGQHVITRAFDSAAFGAFNDTTAASVSAWIDTDPLFLVGNGTSHISRRNALTILKNGNTGIGTVAPQKVLHVSTGSSGATANASAVGVFESNVNAAVNILSGNGNESAVYFGNSTNAQHGGIVYNATPANGLAFRTNGNTTRAVLTDAGRFGIGTTTPLKSLHVSNGSSGSNVNVNAVAVFEDDGNAAINIITPAANESSVLFGNPSNTAHGAILYNSTAPNGFTFRTNGNNTKAVLTDIGRFGLGTTSPQGLFHASGGPSGASPALAAVAVFEDDTDVAINLLSPASEVSTIYFGNEDGATQAGIRFNFPAVKGLAFGTSNNTTRMVITESGDVGIGDNSPNARLHIANGTTGGPYFTGSDVIIEDNGPVFVQLSTPAANEAGILSGSTLTSIRSGISFRADSSIQIRTGGNTTRLAINKTGSVGVNTTAPEARLDVNGTTIIGTNGTVITEIIKVTVLSDIPDLDPGQSQTDLIPVPNAVVGSSVIISPHSALPSGVIIAYARVSAPGTVEAKFFNASNVLATMPAMNFYITVIR